MNHDLSQLKINDIVVVDLVGEKLRARVVHVWETPALDVVTLRASVRKNEFGDSIAPAGTSMFVYLAKHGWMVGEPVALVEWAKMFPVKRRRKLNRGGAT